MTRHLRSLLDLTPAETNRVVDLAVEVKANPGAYTEALRGKSVAMIFAKQSTRTRISFEVGLHQLGAQPLSLSTSGGTGMQMGRGETVSDTAQVLSRFVHAIVIRTFGQDQVDGLAEHGSIPVVNALTDLYHPCQALADLLTIREHLGSTRGKKLVYVGAGNNVAHSLMLAGPRSGMDVVVTCPESLRPNADVLARAQADGAEHGTSVSVVIDPTEAVRDADVIYTDTWVSMGEEEEAKRLIQTLSGYTVTEQLMAATGKQSTIFMHCLPAHRGEEVAAEVMDGPRSVVFDEAENRLHAQKALMLLLMGGASWS
ncbi:ornithine carbamoyltransferase [Paraliomyxa miuraensis]|uniref:ornithine carbamoyltransferase n=1 Tax=Paraliomyxa miuraensis TaxID=376150 RepID=UPI00225043A7|nr:ornithine carbamoyltransferase [Paraliomyxa miuraensis]MCX4242741.1 ornithine carbamoyltransferase [Paraliomyxa miuraensis]